VVGSAATVFRAIKKAQRIATSAFSPKVIWGVVKAGSLKCGLDRVAPHDLRRTCSRLCHEAGGELEQIQFLLGHVSVQTTERYLGCKQRSEMQSTITSALSQRRLEHFPFTPADLSLPNQAIGEPRLVDGRTFDALDGSWPCRPPSAQLSFMLEW
jgi:hypothetical protein